MTTDAANPEYRQHRSERRRIPPFGDGSEPHSLSGFLDGLLVCRFSPFPNIGLTDESRYDLRPDELERPIEPRFEITVAGGDEMQDRLGARVGDFELGVSVRNRHIRMYRVLGRWPLASAPEKWRPDAANLEDLQTGRGMDFVISVIVSADKPELAALGMSVGKVIARKEIVVREPDSPSFPFEWVEFGVGDDSHPKEALWRIDWLPSEMSDSETPFALPVEHALVVRMNKAADQQLSAISQVAGAEGFAWRILAADIATQIWAVVLRETEIEPDQDDADTLAGQTFKRLSNVSGKSYSELRALAEPDGRLEELRSLAARCFEVVK